MKGVFWHFLAALTLTLILVSCGKDNDIDSPPQEGPGTEEPKPEEPKPEEESKPEIIFKLECDWAEGDAVGIYAYDAESKDLVFGNKNTASFQTLIYFLQEQRRQLTFLGKPPLCCCFYN